MPEIYHALGLHMHQPLGNLVTLHNSGERWEARQILWCYDRVTRMLNQHWDVARGYPGHFTLTGPERRLAAGFARPHVQSRLQAGAPPCQRSAECEIRFSPLP